MVEQNLLFGFHDSYASNCEPLKKIDASDACVYT